jgi:hypothetical protein
MVHPYPAHPPIGGSSPAAIAARLRNSRTAPRRLPIVNVAPLVSRFGSPSQREFADMEFRIGEDTGKPLFSSAVYGSAVRYGDGPQYGGLRS